MAKKFELPELPFSLGDLEPVITKEMMDYHYNKHHVTYTQNLNNLLQQYEDAQKNYDLEKMFAIQPGLAFNAGGYINHSIFWTNLAPKSKGGGTPPEGPLANAINTEFGSFANFTEKMNAKTIAIQGSGWGWLAFNKETGRLEVTTSVNQELLTTKGLTPLLCFDVWEHAYYLKYKNARADFVKAIWDIVNWSNISERYLVANPAGKYAVIRG
ncbi:MAG: Superoxide dismutase [Mn] [Chlamydiae bacterium]|nr:Superoxide dismutase [Mn] [Chlamydiota bacterium]